ncbi:MAG TPA: NADH-quinone oxidoreductase subunit NuoK [Cytophagaceae bacterium]|jgi:NADH-quinone oxidoreductase subunit K
MIPIEHFLILSAILFSFGITIVLVKKNAIVVLMGLELMLNAANINLVAFSRYDQAKIQGQFFALFIMVVAVAETAVALAIIVKAYKYFHSINLDDFKNLKG